MKPARVCRGVANRHAEACLEPDACWSLRQLRQDISWLANAVCYHEELAREGKFTLVQVAEQLAPVREAVIAAQRHFCWMIDTGMERATGSAATPVRSADIIDLEACRARRGLVALAEGEG